LIIVPSRVFKKNFDIFQINSESEVLEMYDAMERNLLIDSDFSAGDELNGEYEFSESIQYLYLLGALRIFLSKQKIDYLMENKIYSYFNNKTRTHVLKSRKLLLYFL
jgi:hypothetical protein